MTMDDLLEFDDLIKQADILGIEHDEKTWFDDEWLGKEDELRIKVDNAMAKQKCKADNCLICGDEKPTHDLHRNCGK